MAVTSFLCLRFFSPAIMTPKLFHLRETHADARTSRTLLLLAKVGHGDSGERVALEAMTPPSCGLQAVQMVGNMEPAAGRAKEEWLAPLQPALQHGASQMRAFITQLVGMEEEEKGGEGWPCAPRTAVVKEGLLFVHKTRGKGPLLASASKKLHFCLTSEALSFSKSPGAEVGGQGRWDPIVARRAPSTVSPTAEVRLHRFGQHPCGREGGGEELWELPRHAGGLRG